MYSLGISFINYAPTNFWLFWMWKKDEKTFESWKVHIFNGKIFFMVFMNKITHNK